MTEWFVALLSELLCLLRCSRFSDDLSSVVVIVGVSTYYSCGIVRADLHGTIFVACDNGLRQAHDMIYDCCLRQKKCRSILKHVLKCCGNRKSCRRPVVPCKSALRD